MYIERVPNRKSPPAVLLRESYREGGKVRKRTLANLSKWPDELVRGLRVLLKGGVALNSMDDAFEILRSRPHGHVAAVLGTARKLGLERLLDRRPSRMRSLALAMIAGRVLDPRSKLAAARGLGSETQTDTLGEETGAADATADELYEAMDWLLLRRKRIERTLAAKRIEDGSLVLCDLTSVYFEGSKCPLAKRGYSRDGRRGKLQIVFALLCDREGCPVAAEVFEGNTADPGAVASQAEKLSAPELYPGERLVVCRNPLLAAERARKREALLQATEAKLDLVVRATKRENRPLRGEKNIAVRADRALRAHKVGKHFMTTATDDGFSHERDEEKIAEEAALDGIYVIRTNVPAREIAPEDAVRAYKSLDRVERAFRSFKGVDLKVRPVHHRLEGRVRAHVFLCMLAYYVEWHMRRALAPLLFDDDDPAAAEAARSSPVAPARRSPSARAKAGGKRTPDGLPVHSFQTLLGDLATLTRNRVRPAVPGAMTADILARPTPLQAKAFRLLGVRP